MDVGRWTFCILLLLLCSCKPAPKPLTKLYQLPTFTLTERSGQPFDSATMRGKVWVASFFFASCPGPCNLLNEQMKAIHQGNTGVHLLSISTDVDDTPAVLSAYAKARNADARWLFLTGKKDEVFDLSTKGFKLALADAPNVNIADKFIHSTKIALIDQQGWIRGYYDGFGDNAPADVARLLADIKRVQQEH